LSRGCFPIEGNGFGTRARQRNGPPLPCAWLPSAVRWLAVLDAPGAAAMTRELVRPTNRSGSADRRWTGRKLQTWRKRILSREPLCRHCRAKGRIALATEVDHLVPLECGGDYTDDNAQPLCAACHVVKTAKDRGYVVRQRIGVDGWPSDV